MIAKFGGRFKLATAIQKRWLELMQGSRPLVSRPGRDAPGDGGGRADGRPNRAVRAGQVVSANAAAFGSQYERGDADEE